MHSPVQIAYWYLGIGNQTSHKLQAVANITLLPVSQN
jgi:hypothetical protein